MTIKAKVIDLIQAVPCLDALLAARLTMDLHSKLIKRKKVIVKELEIIQESRVKLLEDLSGGKKITENGQERYELGDNANEFSKQYVDMLKSDIELDLLPLNAEPFKNITIDQVEIIQPFQNKTEKINPWEALAFLFDNSFLEENV